MYILNKERRKPAEQTPRRRRRQMRDRMAADLVFFAAGIPAEAQNFSPGPRPAATPRVTPDELPSPKPGRDMGARAVYARISPQHF
jgi:hypothetical protein